MAVSPHAAAISGAALTRARNEDAGYAGRWLYAIADGLGGHVAGDVASATAIEALRAHDASPPGAPAALMEVLAAAVSAASEQLGRKIRADPALVGMGTTLTAMLWSGEYAALAHIGDSRAYLLRRGRLSRLTEDHNLAKLVAIPARRGAVIVRYLDGRPDRSPDLALRKVLAGDRYLLCTDGLSGTAGAEAIRDALAAAAGPAAAVQRLAELAAAAGTPDDITAIVIDAAEGDVPAPSCPALVGSAAAHPVAR